MENPDAVVIGAGPNGLVAANLLADAGWSVLVLEAEPDPGGGVRSAELTVPGFVHDRFSAFYPLAAASPAMQSLRLEEHGLRWRRAPLALAHPTPDGRCVALSTSLDETAASLDTYAPGDGDAWRALDNRFTDTDGTFVEALLSPFPPLRASLRLARATGVGGLARLTRLALSSVASEAGRAFAGEGGRLLLAGNTLHTDLGLRSATGALFGWMLASLGRSYGFPVPEGGSSALTAALVRRLESRGGHLDCDVRVMRVDVRAHRAVGVTTADGTPITARHAVLADVSAPALYRDLLAGEHLPTHVRWGLRRFRWDHATLKLDWALSGPIPWTAPDARRAGTVHVADSMADLDRYGTQLAARALPDRPFVIVGQMTTADPTRSPAGTETAWAYTHVSHAAWRESDAAIVVDRVEDEIERRAPGFRALVLGRHVATPAALEAADANLVRGALNGGTARLRQQLVLRPVPGLANARTPLRALYLASASAHPGGGVHGACGANAAYVALRDARS